MDNLSDKELFQSAISETPPEQETPVEQPVPGVEEAKTETTTDKPRDERGRFAPKEQKVETPAQPAQAEQQQEREAAVPSWRLREEREAREAAERRAAEALAQAQALQRQWQQLQRQQQPPAPPNVFEDPDGYNRYVTGLLQQNVGNVRYEFSEIAARDKYGDAKVDEALKWVEANLDPAVQARIINSRHPYGEMIRLYDERKVLSEIGTDPQVYVQKKLEEALNDPAFLAKALEKAKAVAGGSASKPVVQLPPSVSRMTSAASPHEEPGDMSDAALFRYAMQR